MKKAFGIILVILLIISCACALISCSNAKEDTTPQQQGEPEEETIYYTATIVNGIGSGQYEAGTTVTILPDVKEGYSFAGWSNGVKIVSVLEKYSFIINNDVILTATYSPNEQIEIYYTVILKPDGVTEDINYVLDGETLKVRANMLDGYDFKNWVDSKGVIVSNKAVFDYTPTKDITLIAKYTKLCKVTVINGTGSGSYKENEKVTITASNLDHKVFSKWVDEYDDIISTSSSFEYVVEEDVTLEAKYDNIQHTVLVDNGSVYGKTTNNKYNEGDTIQVFANTIPGKYFIGWYVDNILVSENNPYAFELTKDISLEARFKQEETTKTYYNITIKADGINATTTRVEKDETVNLSAIEKSGIKFVKWVDSSDSLISTNAKTTITATKDETYIAKFNKEYEIVVNGGTGSGTYVENYSLTINAENRDGYRFVKWTVSGTQVSTSSSYTFNVTSSKTIVAVYVKQYYVTAVGGTGSGYYDENTNATVVATVPSNYRFINWTNSNNVSVSTSTNYTFKVTEDTTLTANCVKRCILTVTNGTGSGTYDENTNVTITANNPSNGMVYVGWKIDGSDAIVSVEKSITIKVTSTITYVAVYETEEWTEILP